MYGALGKFVAVGSGKTANALTLILSDSYNVLIFPELLLSSGADDAGWQQSTGRRGIGGVAARAQVDLKN